MNQRPRKKYNYIPAPNSGAYVILVCMLKAEQNELIKNLTKQQVLDYCNRYSQAAYKDNSKVWSYMKGLIDKSLTGRHIARDPIYFLLDEGRDLAQKLIALENGTDSQDDTSQDTVGSQQTQSQQQQQEDPGFVWNDGDVRFELKAGTFDIVLVVDQREKIDVTSPDGSVKIDMRTLACGDFIWIARPKGLPLQDKTKDLVLDYVVERKRLDDLQSSIFDGRFEQQKLRLLNSGVRRPVYMIEDVGSLRTSNLTSAGLAQAVVNILTHDGIDVEKVKNPAHANDYLLSMTRCLEKLYSKMDLISCNQERLKSGEASPNEFITFSEFQTKGAKITNWTVREMFAKHLIQITGMSDKRVAVIVKQYPTIWHLVDAYRKCSTKKEKEGLLSKMKIPNSNRTIGPALSKRVYAAYAMPWDYQEEEE